MISLRLNLPSFNKYSDGIKSIFYNNLFCPINKKDDDIISVKSDFGDFDVLSELSDDDFEWISDVESDCTDISICFISHYFNDFILPRNFSIQYKLYKRYNCHVLTNVMYRHLIKTNDFIVDFFLRYFDIRSIDVATIFFQLVAKYFLLSENYDLSSLEYVYSALLQISFSICDDESDYIELKKVAATFRLSYYTLQCFQSRLLKLFDYRLYFDNASYYFTKEEIDDLDFDKYLELISNIDLYKNSSNNIYKIALKKCRKSKTWEEFKG